MRFIKPIALVLCNIISIIAFSQQWMHYDTSNSGLTDNWIKKIAISQYGEKWFLDNSNNLIQLSANNSWTIFNYTNSILPNSNLNNIIVDRNNRLIVCSDEGIAIFNNGNWIKYDHTNSCLPLVRYTDVAVDSLGNIWLASLTGVVHLDVLLNCSYYNNANGESLEGESEIEIDKFGRIWSLCSFPSIPRNFCYYDGTDWQVFYSPAIAPNFSPAALSCDSNGFLWGSCYYGIFTSDGQSVSIPYDTSVNSTFDVVNTIAIHNENIAAYSLTTRTLNYYNGQQWIFFNMSNSPLNYEINDLKFDVNNILWLAGLDGIYSMNPDSISGVQNSNFTNSNIEVYPIPAKANLYITFEKRITQKMKSQLMTSMGLTVSDSMYNLEYSQDGHKLIVDVSRLTSGAHCLFLETPTETYLVYFVVS